jgi:hypothetical protein
MIVLTTFYRQDNIHIIGVLMILEWLTPLKKRM